MFSIALVWYLQPKRFPVPVINMFVLKFVSDHTAIKLVKVCDVTLP